MTPKTLAILKKSYDLGKAGIQYLRDEASGHYALLEPADVCVSGEGAGGVNWSNHVLKIVSIDADNVRFRAEPFAATTQIGRAHV